METFAVQTFHQQEMKPKLVILALVSSLASHFQLVLSVQNTLHLNELSRVAQWPHTHTHATQADLYSLRVTFVELFTGVTAERKLHKRQFQAVSYVLLQDILLCYGRREST